MRKQAKQKQQKKSCKDCVFHKEDRKWPNEFSPRSLCMFTGSERSAPMMRSNTGACGTSGYFFKRKETAK